MNTFVFVLFSTALLASIWIGSKAILAALPNIRKMRANLYSTYAIDLKLTAAERRETGYPALQLAQAIPGPSQLPINLWRLTGGSDEIQVDRIGTKAELVVAEH